MRIDRVYVAGYRLDVGFTRSCVASIRHWYPDIPITLVKDESQGDYDTSELERRWNVELFKSDRRLFGLGFGKLEPLFLDRRERCLMLDSDIVFTGRVIDRLERFDEDFVVDGNACPPHAVEVAYFDRALLAEADPDFEFPGYTFSGGQYVANTGSLTRADFEPFVEFSDPPRVTRPDIFKAGEQGVLNYVLMKKLARGEITLHRERFMQWASMLPEGAIDLALLASDSPYDFVVHWAGNKFFVPELSCHAELRQFFDDLYHSRVTPSREEMVRRRMARLLAQSKLTITPDGPAPEEE